MSEPVASTRVRTPELVHVEQEEVLTGEAVALDVQPAGLFLRALGALIDVALSVGLLVLVLIVAGGPLASIVSPSALPMITLVTSVVVMVVLPTTIETASRGRSLGKLAIGARIVRTDGSAIGFRQAFIRSLLGVFEIYSTAGSVALLVGAFTPRAQRLGDIVAGTYSQRTRTPPLPPALPGVPPQLAEWAAVADVARLPDRLARRIAQFLRQSGQLRPEARDRVGSGLLAEASAFVAPLPSADTVTSLLAIAAVRRDREYVALMAEQARVAALAPALDRVPYGFPRR